MSDPASLVFVGGTGRSGTHVVADLLGRHSRLYAVPIECRFHVNPQGFPDLLAGRVTKEQFLDKLRRFWWYRIRAGEPFAALLPRLPLGRQTRGLHKILPRERFETAVARFEGDFERDPDEACRALFCELLLPLVREAGKPGLVEMSCYTIAQAPTLARIFPEARFIHTVRDGRDAGASKVAKRQKREHPRDARQGVEWWLGRLAEAEAGARAVAPERLLTICLDELVADGRDGGYARILAFCGVEDEPETRRFFELQMTPENAHRHRWREGLSGEEQREVIAAYERALERAEGEGYASAPLLRRVYEGERAARGAPGSMSRGQPDPGGAGGAGGEPGPLVFVGGTGRSGTHLIAKLIGRHAEYENAPMECRFHADPGGFPDLLGGRTSPEAFLRRLRGFWWRRYRRGGRPPDFLPWLGLGREARGLHKIVPQERFDEATARFADRFGADPEGACRGLFDDLLRPIAEAAGKPGLVEMTCDNVAAAPTLARIFPQARFVHVVRDGRDASASRVRQGRGVLFPRTRLQGVRWWEARVRRIEAALEEVPEERVLTLSLDWIVQRPPNRRGYRLLRQFLGLSKQNRADTLFKRKVSPQRANVGRWERGLSERARERVRREYEAALERLERDGLVSAPLLREVYEQDGEPVGEEQTGLAQANPVHRVEA